MINRRRTVRDFSEKEVPFGTTVIPEYTTEVKKVLNIPQTLEVAVLIPFGYKAADAKIIPQKELKLESILHTNRW